MELWGLDLWEGEVRRKVILCWIHGFGFHLVDVLENISHGTKYVGFLALSAFQRELESADIRRLVT